MGKMLITTSIVIYNNEEFELRDVINCVDSSLIELIYIIDNSPVNSMETFVVELSDKIVYIQGQGNIGFGAGHNIAIAESIKIGSKYHLVLNPDVKFENGVIEELVKFMNTNLDVGLVMPKVLYPNGEIQYLCKLLPTPVDLIFRRFLSFTSWAKKRRRVYELHDMKYDKIHYNIPTMSGCFMLFRTDAFHKIGMFDERYFMYLEDFDLCRRVHKSFKTAFYPIVSIIHNHGKGSYKNRKLLIYHIKSALKYFNKWGWIFDKRRKKINRYFLGSIQ
jgi:GT2 family glycosyltransferase